MESQLVTSLYSESGDVSPARLHEWWVEIESWADKLGSPISDIEGSVRSGRAEDGTEVVCELTEDRGQFAEALQHGSANALELQSMPPGRCFRMTDWRLMAHYGEGFGASVMFAVGIDRKLLLEQDGASGLSFAGEVLQRSRAYINSRGGFATVMPRYSMPFGYALGIASELPQDMVYDCAAWRRFAGKECGRSMRNVFGYNILNQKHLKIDVGGQQLGDWVNAAGGRGRIEALAGGLFLWTFQEGDDP